MSDTCNTGGSLNLHKIPKTGKIWLPNPGFRSGLSFGFTSDSVTPSQGLHFLRVVMNDKVHAYKTQGGSAAIPAASWDVSRVTEPVNQSYQTMLRGCTGHGNYLDGLPVRNGAGAVIYKNAEWPNRQTNGTSDQPGTRYGNIHEDGWPDGQRFYASAHTYYDPTRGRWYNNDVYGQMFGWGTHGDPNSRCTFTGNYGSSDYHFNPYYKAYEIRMMLSCGTGRDGDYYCRGDQGAVGDEPPGNTANAAYWSMDLYSMQIFVGDTMAPTVVLAPGGMNTGAPYQVSPGKPIPNNDVTAAGVPVQTFEQLAFTADDGAGIRQIVFKLDGGAFPAQVQTRNFMCVYLYATPCPHSSGGKDPGTAYNGSPFKFDVSTLQPGNHKASITVMDGSGRYTTKTAYFQITAPPPLPCYQDVNLRLITTLAIPAACSGTTLSTNTNDDVPSNLTDNTSGVSTLVANPVVGSGIFEYGLDVNSRPGERPLSPGNCTLIEHVIKSSSGAPALSPRERNQIVSVTINLQAFSSRGSSLGEQRTRLTVDVPSRQSPRYRKALGCPS